jgi:uncharacterized membrane protein YhaH (DUF805 family)
MQAVLKGFRNILNFRGRSSRGDFWPFALPVYLGMSFIGLPLVLPTELFTCNADPAFRSAPESCQNLINTVEMAESISINITIIETIIFALLISAITRRLHDIGKSAATAIVYISVELSILAITSLNTEAILKNYDVWYIVVWLLRPYTILSHLIGLYLLYLLAQRSDPYNNRYDTEISLEQIKAMREELTAEASEAELRNLRARKRRPLV